MSVTFSADTPFTSVVTRANAKEHIKVDAADEDTYIDTLIDVAGKTAELYTNKRLWNTTATLRMDGFSDAAYRRPKSDVINLPYPPVQSVTSITYIDINGDSQTWSTAEWQSDTNSLVARVMPAADSSYPTVKANQFDTVTITYTTGYGTTQASIPTPIRQGMLMLIGDLYKHRENIITGTTVKESMLPASTKSLWASEAVEVIA